MWAGMGLERTREKGTQGPGHATLSHRMSTGLTALDPTLATRMGSRGAG